MRQMLLLAMVLTLFTGCPAEMWIPVEVMPRQSVAFEHVQFLEAPPDQPFIVVGIITPEAGEYDTEAGAVKVMRKVAAKHGADAIFIESRSEGTSWKFDSGILGAKGGSFKSIEFRAKAIAYK